MAQRMSGLASPVAAPDRAKKDVAGTRSILALLRKSIAFAHALVVSTLPRGGLKLVQPANIPNSLLKAYDRLASGHDRLAWTAILKNTVVRGSDCWNGQDLESSPYAIKVLRPLDMAYSLAIPLSGPLLAGYPGVVVLLRGPYEEDFTDAEVKELGDAGRIVDEYLEVERPARAMDLRLQTEPWTHTATVRHFIFNHDGKALFPGKTGVLPLAVERQLGERARKALALAKRGRRCSACVALPDERGERWTFRLQGGPEFPAISEGPIVFASLEPEAFEWVQVKPWEVAADEEFARMLPAMRFMRQEFAGGPSLDDIAAKAKLSPFHFHRRFADLVGQTPKQFLVSCQMHEAKRLLTARLRDLSQIAADCGFSHQSHFASRFRQTTGLTPTRWRRLAAKAVQSGRQNG